MSILRFGLSSWSGYTVSGKRERRRENGFVCVEEDGSIVIRNLFKTRYLCKTGEARTVVDGRRLTLTCPDGTEVVLTGGQSELLELHRLCAIQDNPRPTDGAPPVGASNCDEVRVRNVDLNVPTRKIGVALGLGILFFSPVFAWFTLRKGHTTAQRYVALGWMACVLVGMANSHPRQESATGTEGNRFEAATQAAQVAPEPAPPRGPSVQLTPEEKAKAAWSDSQQAIERGDDSRKARQFVAAKEAFENARQALASIEGPAAKTLGLNVSRAMSVVAAKLKLVSRPAERENAELENERARREARAVVCGEKPTLRSWDGAISGLELAVKETAHDPSSIDVSDCSEPVWSEKHCWVFRCKVRGKNAFGALILRTPIYSKSALGFEEIK